MASDIEIILTATDNASGAIKSASISVGDYNNALERLIMQEKNAVVSANLTKKFESMTEAEKDAFIATQNLARATEELTKKEQQANATRAQSESMTTRMSQASQLATNAINALQQAQQMYNQVISETVGKTAAYAAEVSSLSRISGQSAQETSRVIQVFDDLGVSAGQLEMATKKMSAEGLSLNIETLARLSDEYNKLAPGAERADFLTKQFGRSGLDMARAMEQGGAALREMSASQSGSLLLTEQQTAAYEKWTVSVGNAEDSMAGITTTIANLLTPSVTEFNNAWATGLQGWDAFIQGAVRTVDAMTKEAEITKATNEALQEYGTHLESAAGYNRVVTNATEEQTIAARAAAIVQWELAHSTDAGTKANQDFVPSAEDVAAAQKEIEAAAQALTQKYQGLLAMTQSIAQTDETYAKTSADLAAQRQKAGDDLAEAQKKWWDTKGIDAQKEKLAEIDKKIIETADNYKAQTAQIIYSNLMTKLSVDGITDSEFAMAQQAGVTLGIFTQAQADQAIAINNLTTQVANGKLGVDALGLAINALPDGKTIDVIARLIGAIGEVDQRKMPTRPGGPAQAMASGSPPGGSPGGLTWVGETGRELVNLPQGAQVASSPEVKQMASGGGMERIDYERLGSVLARALTSALARSEFAR